MVRGKRGRGVPILLMHEMDGHVQLLAEYNRRRNKPRVFARKRDDAETPYRVSAVIRDLAEKAQFQMPEHMRCTKLRKHLATMTQLINLQEEELEQLANHMGHSIRTRRYYYRLPHETITAYKGKQTHPYGRKGDFRDKRREETIRHSSHRDE